MAREWKKGDVVGYVTPRRNDQPHWYLAVSRTGAEQGTAAFLKDHGFGVYYPMTRVMKLVPRKLLSHKQRRNGAVVRKPKLVPLFPGYILVNFDMGAPRWHELFDLAGVAGLVCNGRLPAEVDDAFVAKWQGLEVDGAVPGETPVAQLFNVGDRARILSGPFASFEGIVERLPAGLQKQVRTGQLDELDESMCASLAVEIFGRWTPLNIELGQIERIS